MLSHIVDAALMRPWEVIESVLARRKPPRDQAWLSRQFDEHGVTISEQAISHWKKRGVPAARYDLLCEILGLTYHQLTGKEPLPWERKGEGAWPFPDIDAARWAALTELQRGEIQGKVREMIEGFERARSGSGESSGSSSDRAPRKAAA